MPSVATRKVSSLYLDQVAVSALNGALQRATGNPSARAVDLITFAESALHALSELEPTLTHGNLPGFAERTASWWNLHASTLHGDLSTYTDTWRRAVSAWRADISHDHPGMHMLALSVLTHRANAWSVPLREHVPSPFTGRYRAASPAFGPYPKHLGDPGRGGENESVGAIYGTSFTAQSLEIHAGAASKSHSIAVRPEVHALTRLLVGKDVLGWLVKHWATRFKRAVVRDWADAPLYAALALSDERSIEGLPDVLGSLETTRLQFLEEVRQFGFYESEHARRLIEPAGTTEAARTADAYDVTFWDFDGREGFLNVEIEPDVDLRAVGFLIMAKRLGILDDPTVDLADASGMKTRLLAALDLEACADARSYTDALLATLDADRADVRANVAAGWHADRILASYLLDRADDARPNSFASRLARGSLWAWPDRWALHRYLRLPLDARLDDHETWSKHDLELPSASQAQRLNQILGHVSGPDTDADWYGWASIMHRVKRPASRTVTIALDVAFAKEALRLARSQGSEREAARELLRWSVERV